MLTFSLRTYFKLKERINTFSLRNVWKAVGNLRDKSVVGKDS